MNDAQLLERLTNAYATLDAPAPSAALAAVLESGGVGVGDEDEPRPAVVVPFARPARPRMRMRYLVAALVASFVAVSGLAVAGALPGPLQRGVSSVVSHFGIDLPSPASDHRDPHERPAGSDGSQPPGSGATSGSGSSSGLGAGATPSVTGADGKPIAEVPAAGASPTTTPTGGLPLGDIGSVTGSVPPPTTLPPGASEVLPPITVPVTLPQITVPPVTLPQLPVTVPTVTVPKLPIFGS